MLLSAESTSVVLQHKDKLVWEIPMMPNPLAPPWLSINFWAMPRKTALLKKVLAQLQHLPHSGSHSGNAAMFSSKQTCSQPCLCSTFCQEAGKALIPSAQDAPKPCLLDYLTHLSQSLHRDKQAAKINPKPSTSVPAVPNCARIRRQEEGLKTGKLNPCAAHGSVGNKRDNVKDRVFISKGLKFLGFCHLLPKGRFSR